MELKLWFSFLLLHVIHVQSFSSQWLINVPSRIPAVEGSCVVIPCLYTHPRRRSLPAWIGRTGIWKNGNKVVARTFPKWQLHKEYKKRAQFLGDLQVLNCTMVLNGVRSTDVGPFHFRIELPRYQSFSFKKNPVSIDVISNPAPPSMFLQVRKPKITAVCSVYHSCPTSPPEFSWSRSEKAVNRSKKLNAWQWKSVSILTFYPQSTTSSQTLNCTVRYSGGKQAMNSIILPK